MDDKILRAKDPCLQPERILPPTGFEREPLA